MKVSSALLALLPLAAAMPTAPPYGGQQITDPVRLAELKAMHADVLDKLNNGVVIPVEKDTFKNLKSDPTAKRNFVIAGLAGMALLEAAYEGVDILATLAARLHDVFTQSNFNIWDNTGYCRTYFQTHSGGEEKIQTFARGSSSVTASTQGNTGWNDPKNSDPPVLFFENESSVGLYSVQFTATDGVAWDGIEGTKKCYIEGLCNPQYVFYRKGYNIVLNTWQSQGDSTSCWYSSGEDCKGLCDSGVKDQFADNGVVWGGKCAIPCLGDEGDGYTTVPKESPKIMVAGDSISHGMESDWTWRYRLSQWFDKNAYKTQFVGPFGGTHGPQPLTVSQPRAPLFPGEAAPKIDESTGLYAGGVNPSFASSGHASWWGRQAAQTKETIHAWVAEHQPDYLLLLLGFNDLGWFVSGPEGLIGNMGAIVEYAREAKSDIKILVGNVVDRTEISGRQDLIDNTAKYNEMLRNKIPNWFRWESPIAYVDVNANYNCRPGGCPDGYDGLHPNAMGEYHIAEAFARVLKSSFGFTGIDFQVPDSVEARTVGVPSGVQTLSMPEGLFTTWTRDGNARGYDIRSRIKGMTSWWSEGPVYPATWGSWSTWVLDGQEWEYQVRTRGDDGSSDWSGIVSAVAHPKTAPGPSYITSVPKGSDSIEISWHPVTGYDVNRYSVIVWDKDDAGAFINMQAASGTSFTATGLKSGHRYGTWVATNVNMQGSISAQAEAPGGLPSPGREVIVGGGMPSKPTGLSVTNIDATTVSLSWSSAANAVGYAIYVISDVDNSINLDGNTTDTTWSIAFLFPGTWHHQFCVAAYNGNLETDHNTCVTPPKVDKRDETSVNSTVTVDAPEKLFDDSTFQMLYKLWSQNVTLFSTGY
ncbi:hypothetical protein F5Y04DRAFT_203576 [Hypomontagnella monticulosa]|nr:hypothetical protein F5Y04DRAFT_203576 [Hypomontagnella monticulosa]